MFVQWVYLLTQPILGLLGSSNVPGAILGARNIEVNKPGKILGLKSSKSNRQHKYMILCQRVLCAESGDRD